MKSLLIDVDEVLADFHTPVFEVMRQVTGKLYAPEDFTDWDVFSFLTPEELDLTFKELYTAQKHRVGGDAFLDDNPHHVVKWLDRHPNGVGMQKLRAL